MSNPVAAADVPAVVEAHLREEESDLLDAIARAADAAADTADPPAELERLLSSGGVLDHLPGVLSRVVAATGRGMRATPVAAPPYVVVTSRGPLLRATLADGRLVAALVVFEVEGGGTYRRIEGVDVDAALR